MVFYRILCDDERCNSLVAESASEAWANFEKQGGKNGTIATGTSFNAVVSVRADRPNGSRTNDGIGKIGEHPDLVWDGIMP